MVEITLAVAVLAGLGSFVAPCILPMIPAFLAYISGTTLSELNQNNGSKTIVINRMNIIFNTIFFVLGFTTVFSIYSVIINSVFSNVSTEINSTFNMIGGIIIISFGIFMILSMKIRKLNIEKKIVPKGIKVSYPFSFIFGLAFAAAWTPCVGPILGTILTLAAATPAHALNIMLMYSLGLGIPFILMGVFLSRGTKLIKKMSKHLKYYNLILGGFIIILGVLVFTNQLAYIANFPLLNELILLGWLNEFRN